MARKGNGGDGHPPVSSISNFSALVYQNILKQKLLGKPNNNHWAFWNLTLRFLICRTKTYQNRPSRNLQSLDTQSAWLTPPSHRFQLHFHTLQHPLTHKSLHAREIPMCFKTPNISGWLSWVNQTICINLLWFPSFFRSWSSPSFFPVPSTQKLSRFPKNLDSQAAQKSPGHVQVLIQLVADLPPEMVQGHCRLTTLPALGVLEWRWMELAEILGKWRI